MAVKRPTGMKTGRTTKMTNHSNGIYTQKCPKCGGTGLYTYSDFKSEIDAPCDLCGSKGYIELSYSKNHSKEEVDTTLGYIINRLEYQTEETLFGYNPNIQNQTEDLIKKDKLLSALYKKINE